MVWYALNPLRYRFFYGVEQEKVDQDSVHLGFRMLPPNLPSEQLHTPDAAASELNFPWMAAFYGFELLDMVQKRWAVRHAAQRVKHLGDSVV